MTDSNTPINQQAEVFDGNVVFDNVFILEKLDYDFTRSGQITISELNVVGIASFTNDVTFGGDITLDEITCRNADVTGIATVNTNLYVKGTISDSSGDAGSAGQLLSSTGSGTNWIAANTTSVANAINVGVNLNSDNSDQFVSFFGGTTGNLPNRVDAGLKYNPSTNILTTTVTTAQVAQNLTGTPTISVNAINASGTVTANAFSGDGSNITNIQAGQVVGNSIFVSGMIILWSGAANNIPTGFVICDGSNNTPDLRDRFVVGAGSAYSVGDNGGANSVTLSTAQLPSHNHSITDPGHVHSTSFDNKKYFPGGGSTTIGFGGAGGYPADIFSMNSQTTGISIANAGSGQSHENRPPYYALCYIMKT